MADQISKVANRTRQFCRTDKAPYHQIRCPSRAGSVKPGKSLSLTELTHSFCGLADPVHHFSTHVWLSALRLLIVKSGQILMTNIGVNCRCVTVLFRPSGPHQCSADAEMKVKL